MSCHITAPDISEQGCCLGKAMKPQSCTRQQKAPCNFLTPLADRKVTPDFSTIITRLSPYLESKMIAPPVPPCAKQSCNNVQTSFQGLLGTTTFSGYIYR